MNKHETVTLDEAAAKRKLHTLPNLSEIVAVVIVR